VARSCSICTHPERMAIETAIVSNGKYQNIAEQFHIVSISSITRHKQNCMKSAIVAAQSQQRGQTVQVVEEASKQQSAFVWNLLAEMQWLHTEVRAIYELAKNDGDYSASARVLGEVRQQTKLFSELLAGNEPGQAKKLEQEWIAVREAIFKALCPTCRLAVAEALFALNKGYHDHDASRQLLEAVSPEDSS